MRYTTRIIVPPRVRRSGAPGGPGAGPRPQAIGVRKSLGFGDPLGCASPGHLAVAAAHPDFAPFFAQQSPQDAVTGRTLPEALAAAARAVAGARHRSPWGADADLLRTPQDVDEAAAAGFTYFTIDLSGHLRDEAGSLSPQDLAATVDRLVAEGELSEDWASPYLDREVNVLDGEPLKLTAEPLQRAAVRLGRAVQHGARMYETISRANRGRPYEVEISLDGTDAPSSTVEHLYLGLELEARGVRLTSLALPADTREPAAFEAALREHVAVASFCGPYKLSFRGERYADASIPVIGRCCGDHLHFKTSAESLFEALRLVWRLDPERLRRMAASMGIVTDAGADLEAEWIDQPEGARRLAAAYAAFPSDERESLREFLGRHADRYQELLVQRFERLIRDLNAG